MYVCLSVCLSVCICVHRCVGMSMYVGEHIQYIQYIHYIHYIDYIHCTNYIHCKHYIHYIHYTRYIHYNPYIYSPIDRTDAGFQASSLPYLRRLQVWVYPLVIVWYHGFRPSYTSQTSTWHSLGKLRTQNRVN